MDIHTINSKTLNAALITILVFIIGTLCSYKLSDNTKNELRKRSILAQEIKGEQIRSQIQDSVDFAINSLRAMQAFYDTNPTVTLEMFNRFSQPLVNASRGHVQALEWIPLITHAARQDFVRRMQRDYPSFNITARNKDGKLVVSQEKNAYHPVTFVIPYEKNRAAHGFDLSSSATRRASLELARDSGLMTSTAKIRLVQETKESFGFLTFAPVYHKGFSLDDAGEREQALKGFVLGVFRIDSLMQSAEAQAENDNLRIRLYDLIGEVRDPIYNNDSHQKPDSEPLPAFDNSNSHTFDIQVQQRHWQLVVIPGPVRQSSTESLPIASGLLYIGLFVSFLLAVSTFSLLRITSIARYAKNLNIKISLQNTQLEATVKERTDELETKNKALEWNVHKLTANKKILTSLMEDLQNEKKLVEKHALELTKSNQDLDDFAYVASHDLKAPLRAIDHLSAWIREDLESGNLEEIPANLDTMQQRTRRLETLLDDLLTYSRAGRQEEKISEVNCNTLMQDIFQFTSSSKSFTLKITENLPTFLTMSAPFEQIIRNFISNAIKHHDKDDGLIQIGCQEEGDYYKFSIQDNGPGIEQKHHEQIFKMFQSLQPRDQVEGSGMGLALIKKIVEHYGGKVSLESALDDGATFYFTWPKSM